MDLLLSELTLFYTSLAKFGTDAELMAQVFKQVGGVLFIMSVFNSKTLFFV